MKATLVLACALLLAACQSAPGFRTAEVEHQMCVEDGFEPGTALYLECRRMLQDERTGIATRNTLAGAILLSR